MYNIEEEEENKKKTQRIYSIYIDNDGILGNSECERDARVSKAHYERVTPKEEKRWKKITHASITIQKET